MRKDEGEKRRGDGGKRKDDCLFLSCPTPIGHPASCHARPRSGIQAALSFFSMICYRAAMNQPQAEGIAQAIHEHESEHLATKADLARLETKLETSLAQLETRLAQLQVKLMTWTTVLAGIIIAVLKLT